MKLLVLSLILATLTPSPVYALWPIPKALTSGSSTLKLSSSFSIQLVGNLAHSAPHDLQDAVARTESQLRNDKLERLVPGGSATDASKLTNAKLLRTLSVSLNGGTSSSTKAVLSIAQNAQLALGQRSEAYTLNVPADGSPATLSANSTLGLFRGLTTFSQIWYTYKSTIYTLSAPIHVSDSPAYPYRGFMLDTARNWFPVADILRTLDGMSYVKASTFHWHVVDSQSFPLVVPKFPELSAKGAYSPSMVYTPADVQKIVSYAGARGIDVMVEIDTPGHTAIIAESHPEFVACPKAAPWTSFANEPPAGQLRLASPAVNKFITSLLQAVLPQLPSKYFSTGGDEINVNCYDKDKETQDELTQQGKTFEQALDGFVQNAHSAVRASGKTPVVWEEMVLSHNVTLANNTVVLVWISSDNAKAVTDKGFQIVHAPNDYFYLDCGHGGWVGDYTAGNSWCDPFKTWQKAYSFNPLANISDSSAHLVLGGQSLLWAEQSSPSNLDSIVWPRAAASAEVFWTGSTLPGGNATNSGEALARLHELRYRFVQRGIQAIALQPHWCAVRPHACDLNA